MNLKPIPAETADIEKLVVFMRDFYEHEALRFDESVEFFDEAIAAGDRTGFLDAVPRALTDSAHAYVSRGDALTAKGADKAALDAHVAKLEAEMRKPEPDHGVISDTLASLETTVGEAEETLEKTGVLRFLNVVFGTGVPNP